MMMGRNVVGGTIVIRHHAALTGSGAGSGAREPYTPWQSASSARSVMESDCVASERFRLIAKAAHYLAQHRCPGSGSEPEDWLKAEREVDGPRRR